MHSCSKELVVKLSKPKMSSTPISALTVDSSSTLMLSLIRATIHSKMRLYSALDSASLASVACSDVSSISYESSFAVIMRTVKTLFNWSSPSPHNWANAAKCMLTLSVDDTLQPSPHSSNVTSERCSMPATAPNKCCWSVLLKLSVLSAVCSVANSTLSSTLRRVYTPP